MKYKGRLNWAKQKFNNMHLSIACLKLVKFSSRKCVTRSSIETNENSIMTSQWKYIMMLLVACLPKMFMLMFEDHVRNR